MDAGKRRIRKRKRVCKEEKRKEYMIKGSIMRL